MDRKLFALYTLVVGALVGVAAEVLFYGKTVGISFPLFIGISIVVVLASNTLLRQPLRKRNLWLLAPMLFFAGMVAIRADTVITMLNVAMTLALGALTLHYLPLTRRVDLSPLGDHILGMFDATFGALLAPVWEVIDSTSFGMQQMRGNWRVAASVGRGLALTVPVLLVFALLLSSADTVFAGYFDQMLAIISLPRINAEFSRLLFIGMVGWLACGTVAYGVARRKALQPSAAEDKPKRKRPQLGLIEASMLLGGVVLLFGAFVVIQFAYFFGGSSAISPDGWTYAEYARRGFFELVAVSVLTLGLVLALDAVTVRRDTRHTRLFRGLAVALVCLTGVLLVSASQRMLLYEAQYGFTTLRVYTHVFMLWLGVLFGFFLLALFRVRMRIFSLGVLVVAIGYLGTLNLINVEGYITERNIARAANGHEVDFHYLSAFSADAAPAILALYTTTDSTPLREASGQWLARQLQQLDSLRLGGGASLFAANLSRDTAWAALDTVRASLPEPDPAYYGLTGWNVLR